MKRRLRGVLVGADGLGPQGGLPTPVPSGAYSDEAYTKNQGGDVWWI